MEQVSCRLRPVVQGSSRRPSDSGYSKQWSAGRDANEQLATDSAVDSNQQTALHGGVEMDL